jgi:prophage regulatory protein
MTRSTETRLLRRPEVQSLTGLSKSTIYQMIASGDFPKQIQIGKRSVFWVEGHITKWIEEKIAVSR